MMSQLLRSFLALSFVSGFALFLCPEGGVKSIMKILCTAMLTAVIITPLRDFDYDIFSNAEARFASAEAEILSGAQTREKSLKTILFSQNCENYIRARAEELGLRGVSVSLTLRESGENEWLPDSVSIEALGEEKSAEALCHLIRNELGIPPERQVWKLNENE